ncbi:MAG: tetraacyldisaccharide 4'-kinase [Deltaproteobacteria bacterium]|nr:tetraacyldisaccharide 4'-kinase [Deltaproteobacteria bacterium]
MPVIVSKNRLSAAKVCSAEDNIYYNLAENLNVFSNLDPAKPLGEKVDLSANLPVDAGHNFSGHCLYKDVHDKYEEYKKIAVLDDGFTALNIKKNLNIVLIDRTKDIFNQNVIPAGVLREPLAALKYADIIIITKNTEQTGDIAKIAVQNLEKDIRKFNKSCPIFYSYYKPVNLLGGGGAQKPLSFDSLKDNQMQILTVCAIGNPDYFYDNLISCGIKIGGKFEFEDHHRYAEQDLILLKSAVNLNNPYIIITTLKDYVKLKKFGGQEDYKDIIEKVYYLDFELVIDKLFFGFIYDSYKKYVEKTNPESIPYIIKN